MITIGPTIGPISSQYPMSTGFDGTGEMVDYSRQISQTIFSQYTFETAPHVDVLLVPGGLGLRAQEDANDTSVQDFIVDRYPSLEYLLGVCVGAVALAKTGLLDGRKATSNKAFWDWAVEAGPNVDWQPSARWIEDGNIWTSSGAASGKYYRRFSVLERGTNWENRNGLGVQVCSGCLGPGTCCQCRQRTRICPACRSTLGSLLCCFQGPGSRL